MSAQRLDEFGGFRKANELFDLTIEDLEPLIRNPLCTRLISQQVAAADSVAANIEEGYGRGSRKEYAQFLVIARGSAREVRGRYHRLRRWLSPETVAARQALRDEIIGILTKTIMRLRSS